MRQFVECPRDILSVLNYRGHRATPMEVHAGREQSALRPQAERGQNSRHISRSHNPIPLFIDIAAALANIFRRPTTSDTPSHRSCRLGAFAETRGRNHSAAVIQRKNDVSAAGEY